MKAIAIVVSTRSGRHTESEVPVLLVAESPQFDSHRERYNTCDGAEVPGPFARCGDEQEERDAKRRGGEVVVGTENYATPTRHEAEDSECDERDGHTPQRGAVARELARPPGREEVVADDLLAPARDGRVGFLECERIGPTMLEIGGRRIRGRSEAPLQTYR